jgi:hypothetical protein
MLSNERHEINVIQQLLHRNRELSSQLVENVLMLNAKNITRGSEVQQESNRVGIAFLITELGTALSFAHAALQAGNNSGKRSRNQANARKGYDTILRLRTRLSFVDEPEAKMLEIERKFRELKDALEQLGELL